MRFEDRVAIVTGGNSGIGKEVARRFVAEGGLVVVNGRNAAKTEAAVKDIDASGKRAVTHFALRARLPARLDETEISAAKFATLTEVQPGPTTDVNEPTADALPALLGFDPSREGALDYDVFASIYNKGKLALLISWRDRPAAAGFVARPLAGVSIRHRVIRLVRDYGMFDRRESPQYYPDVEHSAARREPNP